ncbi:MAG: tetratricopeptide repeat protein [Bacteroidales bacterium]|nr:tetratricopeptide repeat protein [Bacteroidales bacterium]MBQ3873406.1 tetratricopeptide repeat protein [Bacteroidales bacterium]
MKKVLVVIAAFVAAAAVASAQDYNAGIEAFNAGATALQTSKTEALGSFRAALTQFEACEEEEAAEMVAKCKEIIPETILSIAKEQINGSEYDNALTTLAEAVAVAKEYGIENTATEAKELIPNVYMRKGSTLIKEKNFADAVAAFKEVVNLDPDNGQAFLLLGQATLQTGDADAAVEALKKASELGQEAKAQKLIANIFLKKGQSLLKAGKNADAIAALEESNKYVESANAYKLIASALTKSGKTQDSIAAYKKYLEVSPDAKDAVDIIFTIAATAQKAGDKATAKEYYQKLAGSKYAAQAEAQLKTL